MPAKKEDRRIRITRQAIRESLLELLQEQPISKVSVKMICEAADINRSTFYAHYTDQYDLLARIQQEAVAGIRQYIMNRSFITEQNNIAIPILVQILEYAKSNRTLFRVLLSDNSGSHFQNELKSLAAEKTLEEMNADRRLGEWETEYIELFEIAGVISIMKKWVEEDCKQDPAQLAELVSKLLFQGIAGLYVH